MRFELEHPNLTAYALGQLEGDALARTEELLASNEAARRRVEEIRAAAQAVGNTLAKELDAELRTDQLEQIRARLEGARAPQPLPAAASEPEAAPAPARLEPPAGAAPASAPRPRVLPHVPVPRAPSRARRRPAWVVPAAIAAAAVGAVAVGSAYVRSLDPIEAPIETVGKPPQDPPVNAELLAMLRARGEDVTPVNVVSRSFQFADARPARATAQDAPLSLTASDGTGLKLVSLTARAVIEEPLAFTELRLAFANPNPRTIEGRFAITLPEGATISRFAMKIGDRWQEGEVVEKQAARTAYEDFLHRRQDPALLEQAGGNEFTARVFPIPARATKELIVSYSHELPRTDEPYRLALVGLPEVGEADVRVAVGRSANGSAVERRIVELRKQRWVPDQDFVVPATHLEGRLGLRDDDMLIARISPIPEAAPDEIESLFVLFDTSASHALGFSGRVRLLERLIGGLSAGAGPEVPVAVACFDQGVELVYEGPARGFGVDQVRRIEARTALGASDLGRALAFVREHATKAGSKRYARVLVVSDGVATAGEVDRGKLAEVVRSLRSAEVERLDAVVTGGVRDQALLQRLVTAGLPRDGTVSDDRWDLDHIARKLTQKTYSSIPVNVEGAAWVWPETLDGVQAGDQVLVYAELPPEKPVRVSLAGVPLSLADRTLARGERPLIERAFAKARIDRLVHAMETKAASNADYKQALQRQVVELSVQSRVLSPFTALVVLETEADFARFGIARRGLSDLITVAGDRLEVLRRSRGVRADPIADNKKRESELLGLFAGDKAKNDGAEADAPVFAEVQTRSAGQPKAKTSIVQSISNVEAARANPPEQTEDAARSGRSGGPPDVAVMAKRAPEPETEDEPLPRPQPTRATSAARDSDPPMRAHGATLDSAPSDDGDATEEKKAAAIQPRSAPPSRPQTAFDELREEESASLERASAAEAAVKEEAAPSGGTVMAEAPPVAAIPQAAGGVTKGQGGAGTAEGSVATGAALGDSVASRPTLGPPAESRRPAGTSRPDPAVQAGLTPGMIARVVNAQRRALETCITSAQRMGRELPPARMQVRVRVRPSGVIDRVHQFRPTMRDPYVTQCITARIQRWRFPEFYGTPVDVVVPLAFARPAPRPQKRSETFRAAYQGTFADIMALLHKGAASEAQIRAERWRTEAPGDVLALVALGEACEATGDVRRAERAYGSLIDLFPGRADLRRFAGERLDRLHTEDAIRLAEDTYAKAALDRPDHPTGRRLHAYALVKQGRVREAFEEIESVLSMRGGRGRVAAQRFASAQQVLREDLGLIGRAWMRAEPQHTEEIRARVQRAGGVFEDGPSLRFVLNWETDANDVDLHVYDARKGHAYFGNLELPSGGRHYGGVFTGYGPECVTIRLPREQRAHPYNVKVHYYARGPMGYGMGKVQIIEHDGTGGLSFDERPFVAMNDLALVDLGVVR